MMIMGRFLLDSRAREKQKRNKVNRSVEHGFAGTFGTSYKFIA
jgi:hypothetical protein